METPLETQSIAMSIAPKNREQRVAYLLSEVVTFSRIQNRERNAEATTSLVGPLLHLELDHPVLSGPAFDLTEKSPRFSQAESSHDWSSLGLRQLLVSSGAHLVFLVLFWIVSLLLGGRMLRLSESDVVPVEMVFGILEEPVETAPAQNPGQNQTAEALKSPDQLPQLPKVLAVDSVEKPPDTLPLPATPVATPAPKATPIVAEATPDSGARILKAEELLKRLERERRKVGEKNREGTREKQDKNSKKNSRTELPANPLAGVAASASSALPAGALDGELTGLAKAYQLAAQRHVRRQWNLPDVFRFPAELLTQVEVTLNLFGKVLDVKVVKSSGNDEFDKEVLDSVERSNPFPDFSGEEVTKRTLILVFRPREVK